MDVEGEVCGGGQGDGVRGVGEGESEMGGGRGAGDLGDGAVEAEGFVLQWVGLAILWVGHGEKGKG